MKKFAIAVIALAVLLVGTAMAVDPIPATSETQGISTTTGVTVIGTMTNTETIVMTISNQDLRNNPPLTSYWNDLSYNDTTQAYETTNNYTWVPERQAVVSYSESVLADNGYSEFNEAQSMDTANRAEMNQKNLKSTEQFDYIASETAYGRATTSESLLLDLASQGNDAADRFICPFATGDKGLIPAYCNVYEMGSSFTGTAVSMINQASTNFIAKAADVPTNMDYSVSLAGQGSAAAWINAHVMEGRTGEIVNDYLNTAGGYTDIGVLNPDMSGDIEDLTDLKYGFMQSVDLVYKEKTTASGTIAAFSKTMSVQDAMRRL